MIKPRTLEKVLHQWIPWRNALEEGRLCTYAETTKWWQYACETLRSLWLPSKDLLIIYFLSCVFSYYEYNRKHCFEYVRLPTFLYDRFESFKLRTTESFERFLHLFPSRGIRPIKLCPNLIDFSKRPLPPAVWNANDLKLALMWESHHYAKPVKTIRKCYSLFFIILSPDHPIWGIAYTAKREIDNSLAVRCAQMKYFEKYTYKEIGEEFGWPLQRNEYGKLNRCSKAQRYVRRGREIIFLPVSSKKYT